MMRRTNYKSPTILVVTPEITYLPEGMGNMANVLHAKAWRPGGRVGLAGRRLFRHGSPTCATSRCRTIRKMFHVDCRQS